MFQVPNEVCQTQYETSCVTRYKETPVVENVKECGTVYKKVCDEAPSSGYGAKPVCVTKPVEECGNVERTVYKKLPDTQVIITGFSFTLQTVHVYLVRAAPL